MLIPVISIFHGLVIHLHISNIKLLDTPHILVRYGHYKASIDILYGIVLSGELPNKQLALTRSWLFKYQNQLLTNWQLVKKGEHPFTINPL